MEGGILSKSKLTWRERTGGKNSLRESRRQRFEEPRRQYQFGWLKWSLAGSQ